MPTVSDLTKTLDLLMAVYKSQPSVFKAVKYNMKFLVTSTVELNKREVIPLREMVRLATFLNPSLIKPVFFLKEIVESKQSLSKDVSEQEVGDLVEAILSRAQ